MPGISIIHAIDEMRPGKGDFCWNPSIFRFHVNLSLAVGSVSTQLENHQEDMNTYDITNIHTT